MGDLQKTLVLFGLFLPFLALSEEARADRIYRCQKNGVVLFTNISTECG